MVKNKMPVSPLSELDEEDDEEGVDEKEDEEYLEPGVGNPEAAALS